MKRTKFIKRALSSFLAVALAASLASCNAGLPGGKSSSSVNQPRQIVNYFTSEMFEKPEELGYISNVFSAGEKLYVYGEKNTAGGDRLSAVYNSADKKMTDIPLDEINAEYVTNCYYLGDSLLVNYVDAESYEYKFALKDIATGKLTEAKMNANTYPASVTVLENGDISVVEEAWGMSTGSVTNIKVYDKATLEVKSSVKLNDIISVKENESVTGAVYDDEGGIYISSVIYSENFEDFSTKVVKLSPDNQVVYTIDDTSDIEGSGSLVKMRNGNMCIVSTKNGQKFYFNEIDNATGDVIGRYEADLGEVMALVTDYKDENADLAYSTEKGIFTLDLKSNKTQQILSFGSDIPEDYKECYNIAYCDGGFYMQGTSYGETGQQFYILDTDGNVLSSADIGVSRDEYIYDMGVTSDGSICALVQSYEIGEDEDDYGKTNYSLRMFDENGSVVSEISLSELAAGANSYIEKFKVTEGGKILLAVSTYSMEEQKSSSRIAVLDNSGSLLAEIESEDIAYIDNFSSTESGDYVFYSDKSYNSSVSKINYDDMKIDEKLDLDLPSDMDVIDGDDNYDFCYKTSEGLYGFMMNEKKSTEIVNWVDSDIMLEIRNAAFVGTDKIFCIGYDYETSDTQVYMLKRADEETLKKIQNKKIITLAGVNLGYDEAFRSHVTEFNKTSNEYRIQVNDYNKYSQYEDDTYKSGAFQLNNDMAAGNAPDIIVGNGEVDMTSFAAKGLLADLNPYFEKDADLSREDFFENILDVYSYDGKLCQLVSDFTISTLAGPSSKIGAEPGWKFEDMFALRDNGRVFFDDSKEMLAKVLINFNLSEFVDFEKKTCDFDNDRFAGLIDFVIAEGRDWGDDNEEEREEFYNSNPYNRRYADGQCQLDIVNLTGFYDILELQQGAVGEEVTLKGYPSENGCGNLIYANSSLSICSKSKNKDAAWEFIKGFLTEEYQDSLNEEYVHTFPLRKESFEKIVNKSMTSLGERGGYSIETPDGDITDLKPLDEATAEKIRTAVTTASKCSLTDERISEIIDAELEAVYAEEKTSAEAAASVQNKVSLYLKEIK